MIRLLRTIKMHRKSRALIHKELESGEYIAAGLMVTVRIGKNGKEINAEITNPDVIKKILIRVEEGIKDSIRKEAVTLQGFCVEATREYENILS